MIIMKNITDYENGTAYIKLQRNAFKDQEYFNSLLSFLQLPRDCNVIEIGVNQQYSKFKQGGLSHMETIKKNYRGYK